jgi:hypothetical protein
VAIRRRHGSFCCCGSLTAAALAVGCAATALVASCAATGHHPGTASGAASTGAASTGGASTGGASTGGASTGGASTTTAAGGTAGGTNTALAPPSPTAVRTLKWIDLAVGDCLADPPPTDPSVVTVTVVDCATAHQAEVYFRGGMEVNAAVATVANQECGAAFAQYTGHVVDRSPLTVTYLIDSDQDRTSANPAPSTVICLLQAANGQPLSGSVRR